MNSPEKEKFNKRISELESVNDQLITELRYLNALLKEVGFEEGILTLKSAALQLIEENKKKEP